MSLISCEKRIGIIILTSLCLCTYYVYTHPVNPIDIFISKFVQGNTSPLLSEFAMVLSYPGSIAISLLMIIMMSSVLSYKQLYAEASLMWYALGAHILGYILKNLINRPRPRAAIFLVSEANVGSGYPSGTVLFCTVFFGLIAVLAVKQKQGSFKIPIILICSLLTLLVCWSRIYLGAHWFSDTLAGCLSGILYLFFITRCYSKQRTTHVKCILNSKK
jgi:membrane-associated phospholipid phosphatase